MAMIEIGFFIAGFIIGGGFDHRPMYCALYEKRDGADNG